jgi:catechol 2,3-dioxygenase-like lactoylglutathione lyase family enzyme
LDRTARHQKQRRGEITHIHSTAIAVSDQNKALDCYVNTLGWEKAIDSPMGPDMRFLTVVPPGATTQLVLGHTSLFTGEHAGSLPGKSGISLIAPDIDETFKALKERGVNFKGPVETMPWGAKATWFYDPDGNEFFLVNG